MKFKPKNRVFRIITRSGAEIIATEDHPFLTPDGMKEIRDIENSPVSLYTFEGVNYEEPPEEVILTDDDMKYMDKQAIKWLKKLSLLPLKMNSDKLPYLLKVMGYVLGDGTIYFTKGKGTVCFYGNEEDLEKIRSNISKVGFTPSRIYSRKRNHSINTMYGEVRFSRTEHSFKTTSRAFASLLVALGIPCGDKTKQDFILPEWLMQARLWQKRLFLASFFGAELSSPKTITRHGYNFYSPTLSMNKKKECTESGRKFMKQISRLLSEFDIKSVMIKERDEYVNKNNALSVRLRLLISSNPENLIRLWTKVGYEYNQKRTYLANAAICYLRLKITALTEREKAIEKIKDLRNNGLDPSEIYKILGSNVNYRFIERTLYDTRKTHTRIALNFPTFNEFLELATAGLGQSGQVWDAIVSKQEVDFDDYVYDFTVSDKNHNFIANNMVVSNCGVTTIKTNLKLNEVRPKIRQIIETLFQIVPAGLGRRGEISLSRSQINELLMNGAKWVVEQGYGIKEDLDYIEENGRVGGANPDNVSELALKRETNQVGTLGSGNHYLEIQYIDEIYDHDIAKKFGLEMNQILVSIHCGSRALGHQIGTDYLKTLAEASRKYNILIRDRELVCAPIKSPEGQRYFSAVNCAINYAFANRQVIVHLTRNAFKKVFPNSELPLLYNIGHNTVKVEKHKIDGELKEVYVHRKGATRAFGPNREELPKPYQGVGQPVIIGGTMGTASYILCGTEYGEERAFASTCHGSGRTMSRISAKKRWRGDRLVNELASKGIIIKAHSFPGLAEEAPGAYKPVEDVVDSVHSAGLAKKVVRMRPLGCIKG